ILESAHTAPPIGIHQYRGRFPPGALSHSASFQDGSHHVVSVRENVRLNNEIFVDDALYRITAAIDQRLQILVDRGRKGPRHGPSINRNSPAAKEKSP